MFKKFYVCSQCLISPTLVYSYVSSVGLPLHALWLEIRSSSSSTDICLMRYSSLKVTTVASLLPYVLQLKDRCFRDSRTENPLIKLSALVSSSPRIRKSMIYNTYKEYYMCIDSENIPCLLIMCIDSRSCSRI